MKTLRHILAALALTSVAVAQTQNVQQEVATKRLKSDIAVPSGKSATIESGGSLIVSSGATVSGLLSSSAFAALDSGIVRVETGTGTLTSITTSAGFASNLSDETGSGAAVFGTSPAFTTNLTFANSAAPSTTTVAQAAFDTDAWAASRGALQLYDGTAATFVVATLASDTPTNGQVPVWNTGGTITWETSAGGVGGTTGSTDNALLRADGTGGSTAQSSAVTVSDAGLFSFPDGIRQTFNPDGSNAGINVGSQAGDPSGPSNGDLWYDSTANELTARINGANVALGAGGGGGSPGGSDTYVQFNDSSSFGGDAGMVYNKTTDVLTLGGRVLSAAGSAASPSIGNSSSGMYFPSANLAFSNAGAHAFGYNASTLVFGHTGALAGISDIGDVPANQFVNTASGTTNVGLFKYSTSSSIGPFLNFHRAKTATIGQFTTVASGDMIGGMDFAAADGIRFVPAAAIRVLVDGSVSSNAVPGRIVFYNNTSTTYSESARLTSARNFLVGTTSETGLTGAGNIKTSADVVVGGKIVVPTATPASASDTGVAGTITWDASFIYVCTATNTWKRAAIATW